VDKHLSALDYLPKQRANVKGDQIASGRLNFRGGAEKINVPCSMQLSAVRMTAHQVYIEPISSSKKPLATT
jgi:hypothetical protein